MNDEKPQHHIRCRTGDVAPFVLLPGDPGRAESIASHLDDVRHVASNREFTTYTGTYDGVPVSVTSTGIGGPSTAIAVEELAKIGASTLIRVGTCGAMIPAVDPGDAIVATAAIRDEGTGSAYLPIEFPAVADLDVTVALRRTALRRELAVHVGVLHSKDSFYAQKEPGRMPISGTLLARWQAWVAGGALGSEMESATLFLVGSILKLRTGAICLVASSHDGAARLDPGRSDAAMEAVILSALDAALDLHPTGVSTQETESK